MVEREKSAWEGEGRRGGRVMEGVVGGRGRAWWEGELDPMMYKRENGLRIWVRERELEFNLTATWQALKCWNERPSLAGCDGAGEGAGVTS